VAGAGRSSVASADFAVSDVDRDDVTVDLVTVDGSFLPARDLFLRFRTLRCLIWRRLLLLPAVVVLHRRTHTLSV
jgi:hypothetical protein